jgi:hypothetical protein
MGGASGRGEGRGEREGGGERRAGERRAEAAKFSLGRRLRGAGALDVAAPVSRVLHGKSGV